MKSKIIELRQQRAKLIADSRAILDAAEAENRDLTDEEKENWDKLLDDAQRLLEQVERLERQEELERRSEETKGRAAGGGADEGDERSSVPDFQSRGMQGLTSGWESVGEWRNLMRTVTPEYGADYRNFMRGAEISAETRALQADLDNQGGYLVAPMQLVDELIKQIDDVVYLRRWATVISVPNSDSLGVPTLENDPADADWTTELGTGSEDSTMSFGRRELHPHPLAKRIKISRTLISKVPSIETLVNQRLAYKFGITQEKAFLTGSGAGQPLGVFTAHASGIPTTRDVSTGNTSTAVTFDGLIEAKFALKQQYWARARWLGHRDLFKMVAKLKDSDGQYLWRESVRVGEPDRVLGLPVAMSEYAPNTFTASQYVGVLGDFSNYWIADSMRMTMQRLVELYAETNQVGLIGRVDTDGQPVLPEAFVRVQLGS